MEMLNQAFEDVSKFNELMRKCKPEQDTPAPPLVFTERADGREPGENRAMFRARMKRERRGKVPA